MADSEDPVGLLPAKVKEPEREDDTIGPLPSEVTANDAGEEENGRNNQKRRYEGDTDINDNGDIVGPLPTMMEDHTAEPLKKKPKKGEVVD